MKERGTSCQARLGVRAGSWVVLGEVWGLTWRAWVWGHPWEHGLEGRLLQAGLELRGAERVLLWWQVTAAQRRDEILGDTKEADLHYPKMKLNKNKLIFKMLFKRVSGKSRPVRKGQGETCRSPLPKSSGCWGPRVRLRTPKTPGPAQALHKGVREGFVLRFWCLQCSGPGRLPVPPALQGCSARHNMSCGVPGQAVPAAAGCERSPSTPPLGTAVLPLRSAAPRLCVPGHHRRSGQGQLSPAF